MTRTKNNWPTNPEGKPLASYGARKLGDLREKVKLEKAPVGVVPYIEIGSVDVNSKKVIFSDKGAVKGSVFCPENSILISRVRPTRGAVVLIDKKYAVSSAFTLIKPKINPRLVFYFLAWNKKFFEHLENLQKGTSYPSVRESDILRFEVSFPEDENIQQKIVRVLDTVREAVGVQERIIELTNELKKSLMAKIFREGTPSFSKGRKLKKTEIGEIPEDWEVVRLEKVCDKTEQNDPSKSPDKEISYIDVSSVSNQTFKIIEYKKFLGRDAPSRARKILKTDDIIFATVRPYLKRVALVAQEFNNFYGSTAFCVLRSDKKKSLPEFVFYCVTQDNFISKVSELQTGTGYPAVSDNNVRKQLIPLFSLPEQREIAEILQTIDRKIEIEQKKKALYEELFRTMLNKLMNGEVKMKKVNFD